MLTHYKCRNAFYPRTRDCIARQTVKDDKVSWTEEWEQYDPPYYNSEHIINQLWADPEIGSPNFNPLWNAVDGKIDRLSFLGKYRVDNGYPVNPVGRTGLSGRGLLGRWGPNHAADPIVTRWKKIGSEIIKDCNSLKPILQFVAIKRRDCNEWAIPGGMVDPGELITTTLKREFLEEALNSLEMTLERKDNIETHLTSFFSSGETVYEGYVDDVRNTDNAWIETTATHFHDNEGHLVGCLNLHAGDDAIGVSWMDISRCINLYASHTNLIKLVADRLSAHW